MAFFSLTTLWSIFRWLKGKILLDFLGRWQTNQNRNGWYRYQFVVAHKESDQIMTQIGEEGFESICKFLIVNSFFPLLLLGFRISS